MKHLEFVEKISNYGCNISATGRIKKYEYCPPFGEVNNIISDGLDLKWEKKINENPLSALIKMSIDMDSWKHSWHTDIKFENYDKFRDIIQQKIIDRAKEIDMLLTTLFQLNYELSHTETSTL